MCFNTIQVYTVYTHMCLNTSINSLYSHVFQYKYKQSILTCVLIQHKYKQSILTCVLIQYKYKQSILTCV